WAAHGKGNRNPVVILNSDEGSEPITIEKKRGKSIVLDASKSYDPENDQLSFKWWILPEAGTYDKEIEMSRNNSDKIKINVPADSQGKSFHIICEVTDNGEPALTSYRRIIVHSK